MTFLEAHMKLGHPSIQETKKNQSLGWELTNIETKCEACAIGKAKQKGVTKQSNHQVAKRNGERIFLDLTSLKNTEFPDIEDVPKPYWRIIVDERTQMKFSEFYATKKQMVEPTCEFINYLKNQNFNQ